MSCSKYCIFSFRQQIYFKDKKKREREQAWRASGWKLDNLTTQRAEDNTLLLFYDQIWEADKKMFYKWLNWHRRWLKGTWQKLDVSKCVLPHVRHFSSIFHSNEENTEHTQATDSGYPVHLKKKSSAIWRKKKYPVTFFQLAVRNQYCP